MEVTFNAEKNARNINKHGISLGRAEDFDFGTAFFEVDDSQDYGELRYIAIGWLDAALFTLTFTQENELIRPISLRKSTKQERTEYAKQI